MKTKEEILKPYIEVPFRHTQVIEKDNALKAMDEYTSQFQQEWIPVEVRLPEDCRMLFVTLDNGTVSKGRYWPDGWRFLGSEEDKVIAWMESHPKPYNPKQS